MEDGGRWAPLDEHLPPSVRADLELRFWRPIEDQARLESLIHDPSFFADPGRHPAMFADHGVVHVRDVATGLVHLVETVDGVLLAARPPARRTFLATYGVALAYLHDIGMVDMSAVGRRVHPEYGAHSPFWPETAPLLEHLLGEGSFRARLDEVDRMAPFGVPIETVARELLSLTVAHSKSTIPAGLLDDRAALRREMQRILFTSLDAHRARAAKDLGVDRPASSNGRASAMALPDDPRASFEWLAREDGPQGELADDAIDALRVLRAADVLRQRGTALRTSGGYEVCFDARTARAVCTLRTATGDAAYVITYEDARGAGEANIRVAYVTSHGHLRIAFHHGLFGGEEAVRRAAASVGNAILDIQSDVLPSFAGRPARGLPPPTIRPAEMRIQLEEPRDDPAFADAVAKIVTALDPRLTGRVEVVSNLEDATPEERARFLGAEPIDRSSELAAEILERLDAHGAGTAALDRSTAFREVVRATIRPRETLVAVGSSPSFAYVPMGPGLVVLPGGGYAPSSLNPWVPIATTGIIRGAERNSEVVAVDAVDVVMIPAERYAREWLRPLGPEQLRTLLAPPLSLG